MSEKITKKRTIINKVKEIISQYTIPLTVRQVYYRLVVENIIPNTRQEYKHYNGYLVKARESGEVPYSAFASDKYIGNWSKVNYGNWREELKSNIEVLETSQYYLPSNLYQRKVCVIILEKNALRRLFENVMRWENTILIVGGGYNAVQQIYEFSKLRKNDNREIHIYSFSDFDPSGIDIERNFLEKCKIQGIKFDSFRRIALTEKLIDKYKLPLNPTKKTDSRAKNWKYPGSVELDALEPSILDQLVKDCMNECWDKKTEERKNRLEKILQRKYKKKLDKYLGD